MLNKGGPFTLIPSSSSSSSSNNEGFFAVEVSVFASNEKKEYGFF